MSVDGKLFYTQPRHCGTTYQHTDNTIVDGYMAMTGGNVVESRTNYKFTINVLYRSTGWQNYIIWGMGLYTWNGTSTAMNYEGTVNGSLNKGSGGDLWCYEYTIDFIKRDAPTYILPWAQICGFAKYANTDNHWANGDFWIYGNEWGALDMRTIDTANVRRGTMNYAGVMTDAWIINGSSTNWAQNPSKSYAFAVPAKGIPIYVYNSSKVPRQAQAVYVYDSSGKPRKAAKVTVYDSSGKPRTIVC